VLLTNVVRRTSPRQGLLKVMHIVGARPNFMKTAPVMAAMAGYHDRFQQILVHTGQHYDYNMSQVFFGDLGLPPPDACLEVGSGSHAQQTASIMQKFESVAIKHRPDWVVVVGDVNSTFACALVANRLGIKVAHVEAGLRSYDRSMPEEINRILTDRLADLLLTPSPDADANLLREGVAPDRIRRVGNVMIDSLVRMLPRAKQCPIIRELDLEPGQYVLATLHRPPNVDDPRILGDVVRGLLTVSETLPVVFPVHPRTRKTLDALDLPLGPSRIRLLDPLGYVDFLALLSAARLAVTDSGGVQEETTYLGIPCLTLRPNTERPITVELGTNRLVDARCEALTAAVQDTLLRGVGSRRVPELWDGRTGERIAEALADG
jgi:UDP-N-acetylglucosamine 2-epimerase (non-hydrolysing)